MRTLLAFGALHRQTFLVQDGRDFIEAILCA
jgi:hypothetical protein